VDLAVLTVAVARHDGLVDDGDERVEAISAVTLATTDMAASVAFYERLGFHLLYGGRGSPFTSFRAGGGYLNLQADDAWMPPEAVWGRVIFHVDDVDAMYEVTLAAGLTPSAPPADAPWRERFFHIRDPDGHELSFARPLPEGSGDQPAGGRITG
jgi:catechol 2,3-dioxygenase-like lactoylglutathione lyase family enzyme